MPTIYRKGLYLGYPRASTKISESDPRGIRTKWPSERRPPVARFTVNIWNSAFKELNRGNCIHRTIYNYHPDEIGYCSPAKECYRNEKPYYFSEFESPDIYLTNTTTDGQVIILFDLWNMAGWEQSTRFHGYKKDTIINYSHWTQFT